jgi:hypothetical protein
MAPKKTNFQIGWAEVDITPSGSVLVAGYYYDRRSTGIHDRLYARSMAVSDGTNRVVLCVCDLIELTGDIVSKTCALVGEKCGLAPENLVISVIHSHTSPDLHKEVEYVAALPGLLAESICGALGNLAPRELSAARGEVPGLQFIRRYRMKDGSVRTNPGIGNPNVVAPIGTVAPDLQALVISEKGRPVAGLVHFALHCDTVGGTEISADWTHFLRQGMQKKLGADFRLLVPIGACGDVNHWNVFKDVSLRGFDETQRIGDRISKAALETIQHLEPVKPDPVCGLSCTIQAKTRWPSAKELKEARALLATPAPEGVDFTIPRVVAQRMVNVSQLGRTVPLDITVLAFGNAAIVGIPAEYFAELGRSITSRSPFAHTLVCTLANGCIGYVPARQNYDEGGYEAISTPLLPGVGEEMADKAVDLLRSAAEKFKKS